MFFVISLCLSGYWVCIISGVKLTTKLENEIQTWILMYGIHYLRGKGYGVVLNRSVDTCRGYYTTLLKAFVLKLIIYGA